MIARYAREEMARIWTEERKLQAWFDVELAAVEGWSKVGVVPAEAAAHILEHAVLNVERVLEIEAVTRHDVAAFVQSLEESVGGEYGRWIHYGLTSSDVLDTALALTLRDAADLLMADIDAMMEVIRRRAFEFQMTPMIGRSHGIHAEVTTFGHVLAIWYDEMRRHRRRLEAAREVIACGKISGAVGTFANVPPEVEAYVCEKLGLTPAPASSQIVQRDRHAEFFTVLAQIASSLEKFSVEIRHLQRTEVLEAEEKFRSGQKGSSAMPHKRNPVLSENVTGLARLVRGYAMPALENVALWHERDISHSSVERVIGPDATVTLDFALVRMTRIIDELVVYPENMRRNLEQTRGLPFSQSLLLALVRCGLSRQQAYQMVQVVAMRAWEETLDFEELVRADAAIGAHLDEATLDACFDLEFALRHIPSIFQRVFGDSAKAP
jgi:adenylosuccinate lyase